MEFGRVDEAVEAAMAAAGIPGVAIGVVRDGEVVYTRGYGVRDIDARDPLTPQTPYPIASTTKAINATLLAMLVDDGLLSWDRPVREYLPGFDLADPDAGRRATLRDLVSMRTGLPRHDHLWATGSLVRRDELVARFRHLPQAAGFRERFYYNNLTVILSGHVAEVVTGRSWRELVEERVLGPLGMTSTTYGRPDGVTASYRQDEAGALVPAVLNPDELCAPSGGVLHSTIDDMLKWSAFNLGDGEFAGRRLVSTAGFAELRRPQAIIGDPPPGGYSPTARYAYGWFVDDVRGDLRVGHGGYLNDVDSTVTTFPGRGIGIVCFSTLGPFLIAKPIAEYVVDLLLDREPALSLTQHVADVQEQRRARAAVVAASPRAAGTHPSHALADYAGDYDHPGYGPVSIEAEGERLALRRGDNLDLELEHWHYDSWVAADAGRFGWREHGLDRTHRITFDTDGDGRIAGVSIRFEILTPPIRFTRRG